VCILLAGCSSGVPGSDVPMIGESTTGGDTDGSTEPITVSSTITTTSGTDASSESGSDATGDPETGTTDEPTTGADCMASWRVDVPGVAIEEAALGPGERVFVAGNDATAGAVLLGFDRCTGEATDTLDVNLPGANSTAAFDIVVESEAIYVAGIVAFDTDPSDGWYTRVEGTPLATVWSHPLHGGDGYDEIGDLAVAASGRLWLSGGTGLDVGPQTAWAIRGEPGDGLACGFPWGGAEGYARAIVRNSGGMRSLVVTTTGQLVVLTYADDDCVCGCTPIAETMPISIGTASSAIGSATAIDDQIYIAGWASDTDAPNDVYAVLVWLDADGDLVDVYRENATAAGDGYLQIVSDGQRVYVGGIDGFTGGGLEGTARLDVLAVPLPVDATPEWSGAPMGLDYVAGLAVENGADGGLFLAANADGQGVVARCEKTGC
jgi:hypothetical protein